MRRANFMSTGEVAKALKVSINTAAKYIRIGGIKGYCHPLTGRCYAEKEDVERIAKKYGLLSIETGMKN